MLQLPLIKLAAAGILLAALAAFYLHYRGLKSDLFDAHTQVSLLNEQVRSVNEALRETTQSRDELKSNLSAAEITRAKVQADLQTTLRKLRNQRPPTECKAALDWAVDNKDDLKW